MEIKLYTDRCLTCYENQRLDTLHFVAKQHGLKVNMRRVYMFPELREESPSDEPMPFIELNGRTLDFFQIGKDMLRDKVVNNFIKNEE